MRTLIGRVGLVVMLAVMLTLAGCEKSKMTDENYDKVTVGMTVSAVESLMGPKTSDDTPSAGYGASGAGVITSNAATENIYVWKSKDTKYVLTFKDGKLVQKSKVPL